MSDDYEDDMPQDPPPLIPVRHVGPKGCGRIAFFMTEKPSKGDYLSSRKGRHANGRLIGEGEVIACDHCGCDDLWPLLDEQGWPVVVTRPTWTTDCIGCIGLAAKETP